MLSFGQFIAESVIPAKPGTEKIPDGHVRLYHQSSDANIAKIKKHGIKLSHAKGIEGPKGVWANEHGFYGKPGDKPTVEFHVPKHEWDGSGVIRRDIHPHEIIAAHHPWHRHARYMLDNPAVKAKVENGEHDKLRTMSNDHRRAIDHVKKSA
jgi:hypothetical protein